jgi:hypothetical protein
MPWHLIGGTSVVKSLSYLVESSHVLQKIKAREVLHCDFRTVLNDRWTKFLIQRMTHVSKCYRCLRPPKFRQTGRLSTSIRQRLRSGRVSGAECATGYARLQCCLGQAEASPRPGLRPPMAASQLPRMSSAARPQPRAPAVCHGSPASALPAPSHGLPAESTFRRATPVSRPPNGSTSCAPALADGYLVPGCRNLTTSSSGLA